MPIGCQVNYQFHKGSSIRVLLIIFYSLGGIRFELRTPKLPPSPSDDITYAPTSYIHLQVRRPKKFLVQFFFARTLH